MFRRGWRWIVALACPDRQCCARFRLDKRDIGAVDAAIESNILTEVTRCHKLPGLGLGLSDIAGIHSAIGSGVAGQNGHWNHQCAVRINSVAHIAEGDGEFLSIGHSGKINSDLGAVDAKAAHATGCTGLIWIWSGARARNRNRNWKGQDHLMAV